MEQITTFLYLLIIIGCTIAVVRDYFLDPDYYFPICRFLKKFTSWYRRIFRSINLEKIAPVVLGSSLLLVVVLTLAAGWGRDPGDAYDHIIYESLKVVFAVFEGDSDAFRAYTSQIPLLPLILPILVPLSATATAVTLIWNYLPHHVPWFSQVWYIFSELEPNSIRMAKSIHDDLTRSGDTGVFIFLRTQRGKQEQDVLDELKGMNYFFYPRNEQRFLLPPWRRRRILRFFFLTENTDENFNYMQDFLTAAGTNALLRPVSYPLPDGQSQHECYLLSETESAPMLIDHLRSSLNDPVYGNTFAHTDLRLLDRFRAVCYDLLRRQPLHQFTENSRLHVLLLGFGRIGREFFRAACSMGVLPGITTEFTLCDRDIGTKLDHFTTRCPELPDSVTIHPCKLELDSTALDRLIRSNTYHYIVVALGDDERNIRVATRLKRYYRRRHWEDPDTIQPQICVNVEDAVKYSYTDTLWKARQPWDTPIHTFGGLDQAFTTDVLMTQTLWDGARWIHRHLKNRGTNAPLKWGEYERRASIASAAHAECYVAHLCGKHFREIGPMIGAHYRDALNRLPRDQFEKLIDTEHRRWMTYVRSEGMQHADIALVETYFSEVGSHVDVVGRLTPCLVDAAELEKIQQSVNALYAKSAAHRGNVSFDFRKRDKCVVEHAAEIYTVINPEPPSTPAQS